MTKGSVLIKKQVIEIVVHAQHKDSVHWGDLKDLEAAELGKKKRDPQVFTIKGPRRHEVQVVKNEATRQGLGHPLCCVCMLGVSQ